MPGLLEQAALNQDRFLEVRLFETGIVYWEIPRKEGEETKEERRLACVFLPPDSSFKEERGILSMQDSLLDMRQSIEALFHRFMGPHFQCIQSSQSPSRSEACDAAAIEDALSPLHPKARLLFIKEVSGRKKEILSSLGVLHPIWEKHFGIKRPALLLDLNFDAFYRAISQTEKEASFYTRPSVYPDSYFEISVLAPVGMGSHIPSDLIQKMSLPEIESVRYLKEYQGSPLASNQKSLSYQILCRHPNKTLKGEELQEILDKVVAHLKVAGFPLRT